MGDVRIGNAVNVLGYEEVVFEVFSGTVVGLFLRIVQAVSGEAKLSVDNFWFAATLSTETEII